MSKSLVVVAAALFVTNAFAQGAPAQPNPAPATPHAAAPKPPDELNQIKFLVGSWKCDVKQEAGPAGPGHSFKATQVFKATLDNYFLFETYTEQKSKEHAMPVTYQGFYGYDPIAKQFVRLGANSIGAWDHATAPGFEGDKLVLGGDMGNEMGMAKLPYRYTLTKKSDKEMGWTIDMVQGDKTVPFIAATCKK